MNKLLLVLNGLLFFWAGWMGYTCFSPSSQPRGGHLFRPLAMKNRGSHRLSPKGPPKKIEIQMEKFLCGLQKRALDLSLFKGKGEISLKNFPFRLRGAVVGPTQRLTFAFLEEKATKKQKTYSAGDVLEGFKIRKIHPQFIELAQRGKVFKLFISFKSDEVKKPDVNPLLQPPSGQKPAVKPPGDDWIKKLEGWIAKNPQQFKQMAKMMRRTKPQEFRKKMKELKQKNRPLFRKVRRLLR